MDKEVYIDGRKIAEDLERYRKIMVYLQGDLPIKSLCLPKVIENKLIGMGCLRVYDVIDMDLAKVKGLGSRRRALLSSTINEFLSISL